MFQFTLPCRERPFEWERVSHQWMFQFTLPCRERRAVIAVKIRHLKFQFTLPCRERLKRQRAIVLISGFNSRSRVGSDGR